MTVDLRDSKAATGGGTTAGRPFRPGRTSTGRLELELLPLEPKEQYASRRNDRAEGK